MALSGELPSASPEKVLIRLKREEGSSFASWLALTGAATSAHFLALFA
jgi:hypothetical protein